MQIRSFFGWAAVGMLAVACNDPRVESGDDGNQNGETDPGDLAPPFPEGQGQTKTPQKPYAPGPYGINKGSTIQNFKFQGFHTPATNANQDALEGMQLADFYNPTGTGTFPADYPVAAFAGKSLPKALLIDVSAVWCNPCQYESANILPGEHEKFSPRGGEFLLVLGDGGKAGTPPVPRELHNWVTRYKLVFPSVIDPSQKLGALFDQDAFPTNMIIDLKTMKIVDVIAGVPQKCDTSKTPWANNVGGGYEFWQSYESLLDGATTCAQDYATGG